MNKVFMSGRVAKKTETRYTNSGHQTTAFSLAVKKDYVNNNQEADCHFFNCVCWNSTCDFLQKYIGVGDLIFVEGNLNTSTWTDQQGQNRIKTEIVVNKLEILNKKNNNQQQPNVNPSVMNEPTPPPTNYGHGYNNVPNQNIPNQQPIPNQNPIPQYTPQPTQQYYAPTQQNNNYNQQPIQQYNSSASSVEFEVSEDDLPF